MVQIDMQKPKKCDECRFCEYEQGYCTALPVGEWRRIEDASKCPLVEVETEEQTMTREEAIKWLESLETLDKEQDVALKMAIEALRHQVTQAYIKVDFSEEDIKEIIERLQHGKVIFIPTEYAQDATEVAETHNFCEGELIVCQNGGTFEIGEIKRMCDEGAFVYYHEGDTACLTPFENMHKLQNAYCIKQTSFALDRNGGMNNAQQI